MDESRKITNAPRAKTGCWTCKDRKVACDRQIPFCAVCSKSKRPCGGYGMRLSWPREKDAKRAVVYQPALPSGFCKRPPVGHVHYINASMRDVSLYEAASLAPHVLGRQIRERVRLCLPHPAKPWKASLEEPSEHDLLEFFKSSAVNVLAMLDSDREQICRILMQMALSDNTYASRAVLNSILAVAALLKDGQKAHTAQYKRAALDALLISAGTNEFSTLQGSIKHVAAGILLCTFEMHQVHEENSQWIGHVCGAQGFIRVLERVPHNPGSDEAAILGWALYYDVLCRFSLRHWFRSEVLRAAVDLETRSEDTEQCALQYLLARSSSATTISNITDYAHPVLALLSEVCSTSLDSSEARYHSQKYQDYLVDLRNRLVELPASRRADATANQSSAPAVIELFKLTALIYLERVSKNFSGPSEQIEVWAVRGFELLRSLDACTWPFPLFILAGEARTDERRRVILDVMARTAQKPHLAHLHVTKVLIETAWVRCDLDVDGTLNYIQKLNMVMSSSDIVPAFV
ncbi:uncharacterized protein PV09_07428 [Verruconis gallopava]|uniref:Zn(2)-C6 fungal-type domain-containing protein n=1 Tax=Verruconis gallopava TaxID=253628 RepID=A0A0D1YJV2_9PEZI|nr:uncharacterized protein PV09_07428 [Verruconis gallopava]KIW01142.1 hypothetical protein PV09_07428 [Verruconis gallopava]